MSLAETALQERAESADPQDPKPAPGKYAVESTGAPQQVPLGATLTIDSEGYFSLNEEPLGPAEPLLNGDFVVKYEYNKAPAFLQFRQSGLNAEFMFGVSAAFSGLTNPGAMPMEDPPVTGVWGAEARPPQEPYPGS